MTTMRTRIEKLEKQIEVSKPLLPIMVIFCNSPADKQKAWDDYVKANTPVRKYRRLVTVSRIDCRGPLGRAKMQERNSDGDK